MAKDNREIVHGIRQTIKGPSDKIAKSKTFVSGMEDELAGAYSQADLNKMLERGDITGNWKSLKGKAAEK